MKKLLALVLCVMMFASLSVNAFAAPWQPATTVDDWAAGIALKNAAIRTVYEEFAADVAMYNTSVAAWNITSTLTDAIMDTIAAAGPSGYITAAERTAALAEMRAWFGNEMATLAPTDLNSFVAAVNATVAQLASAENVGEIQNAVLDAMIANVEDVYSTLYAVLSAAGTDYNDWLNGNNDWADFGAVLGSGMADYPIAAPAAIPYLAPAGMDPLAPTNPIVWP